MIINIRGINGAGKSTLVREIMSRYSSVIAMQYPEEMNKRKPMGYICKHHDKRLFILGHYEIKNGGMDTLPSKEFAYKLVLSHHEFGADVLFEGMNWQDNIKNLVWLHQQGLDVRVMFIDISIKKAIQSVHDRGHDIAERTFEKLYKKTNKQFADLGLAGVYCVKQDRATALNTVVDWLWGGIDARPEGAERMPSLKEYGRLSQSQRGV
jgi:predicted ABC-type ATPase